jgi:hypothetical protein
LSSCDNKHEAGTYAPFVNAANCALRALTEVTVHGIPAFKVDSKTNVLLHVNDPMPMYQSHQGEHSERKPDVVVVSHQTALGKQEHQTQELQALTEAACKSPKSNFEWADVRSTLEFKRARKPLIHPPDTYKINNVIYPPSVKYMEYRKSTTTSAAESTTTSAAESATTSAAEPSHECKL